MEFVTIPGGRVAIGSSRAEVDRCVAEWRARNLAVGISPDAFTLWIEKEFPRHEVDLARFAIGRYPVTVSEYRAFVEATRARQPAPLADGEPADHPVWDVTIGDAREYAAWHSSAFGRTVRLPTEHEWEHAARGWTTFEYPYGERFDPSKANTIESRIGRTVPVQAYEAYASPFGVVGMAGNVEEWTASAYRPYPGGRAIEDDFFNAYGLGYAVVRGGSFALGGDVSRCARRHGQLPAPAYHRYVGFRLASDV